MQTWEKRIWYLVHILLFIALFGFFIGLASASSNFSVGEQDILCDYMNWSYGICYEFWIEYESNDSVIVDVSINLSECELDLNESLNLIADYEDELNETSCFADDLLKIDDYDSRGFEPDFVDGVIVNWKKKENSSCAAFDCTLQCSDAVRTARSDERSIVLNSQSGDNSEQDDSEFMFYLSGIIGFVVLFFGYKYYKKKKPVKVEIPVSHHPDVSHPEPPKPVVNDSVAKEPASLKGFVSSDLGEF